MAFTKLEMILGGVVLAGILLGGYEWLQSHDAKLLAMQQDKDTKIAVAQIDAAQKAAADKEKADLAVLTSQFDAQMKTLQGQIVYLQSNLNAAANNFSKPIVISQATPSKENPNPPIVGTIPQEDLPQLDAMILEYNKLKVEYPACQADLVSEQQKNLKLTADNKQLVTAAKGGTFWHRLGHDLKLIGIGVGIGAAIGATHL